MLQFHARQAQYRVGICNHTVERIRHERGERVPSHRPVGRVQLVAIPEHVVRAERQMRALAASIVDFQNAIARQLALDREGPLLPLRIHGVGVVRARIEAEESQGIASGRLNQAVRERVL